MPHIVYIALGSNLGNRLANLKNAVSNLAPQLTIKKRSPVYETPPWGYTEQPAFLNQVIKAETYQEPQPLLGHLKRLESALGREANFQNGPRLIDLDILFYDDLILDSPPLVIPHPRLHQRAFVLVPLNDVAPNFFHPLLGRQIHDLLSEVDPTEIKRYEGRI